MSITTLNGPITINSTANGYMAVYQSQQYVFVTAGALTSWITSILTGA